jgi:outer membrane receptor protein involved in Fe transport
MQPGQGFGDGTNGPPQGNPFATILTGFAAGGQLNIVPAVADKSKETAFFVQDDWKVTPRLTLNVGLRYEWSTPYSERQNRLQFSNFTGSTGVTITDSPAPGFPALGTIAGTTVFPTANRRNSTVDRNNFAPRLGFA